MERNRFQLQTISEIQSPTVYSKFEASGYTGNKEVLNPAQRKVLGVVVNAQREDRAVQLDELKKLYPKTNRTQLRRIFAEQIENINSKIEAKGHVIEDIGHEGRKDGPPKYSWRMIPKTNDQKKEFNEKVEALQDTLGIDHSTYKNLKALLGSHILAIYSSDKSLTNLIKSPQELVERALDFLNKRKNKPKRQHKRLSSDQSELIKEFIIDSVKEPIDEFGSASEEKLSRLDPILKKVRGLKLLLQDGTTKDKEEILEPIIAHFSEPTSSQVPESPEN